MPGWTSTPSGSVCPSSSTRTRNFLEEIAKFRAARRLWARIMKERFGATDPKAQQLRFHTQTAGSTLTAQQVDNNVVRVALQALSAVLGGTQSLHCNGRDEALGLPTESAAQLALRTQQIIAYETGVTNTVDPVGGSWAVERATNDIEAAAVALLERIDEMGGSLRAIESGFIQGEIQDSAYRAQQAVDTGETVVVGVNRFASEEEPPVDVLRIDPAIERDQIARLATLRSTRDQAAWEQALSQVRDAASGTANLLPPIIGAVEARATVGEIADTLRKVFGEYREGD